MVSGLKSLAAATLLVLAGCTATGHYFDSSQLSELTPGRSTMAEAAYVLHAPPDKVYPQSDGTTLALWQYHVSFVYDGVYRQREAILQFGPDGRLVRLIDGNVLLDSDERRRLLGVTPPASVMQRAPIVAVSPPASNPTQAVPGDTPSTIQTYVIPVHPAPQQ